MYSKLLLIFILCAPVINNFSIFTICWPVCHVFLNFHNLLQNTFLYFLVGYILLIFTSVSLHNTSFMRPSMTSQTKLSVYHYYFLLILIFVNILWVYNCSVSNIQVGEVLSIFPRNLLNLATNLLNRCVQKNTFCTCLFP